MMKRTKTWAMIALVAVIGCAATPTKGKGKLPAQDVSAGREEVVSAMQAELDRSVKLLKFKDYVAPYFVGYHLRDLEDIQILGKYGGIVTRNTSRNRYVYVEVRVGDYGFDNFANIDNESFRMGESSADKRAPLDNDPKGLRGTIWLLTDESYKKALSEYLTKKGGAVYAAEEKLDVPSFSKEKPQKYRGAAEPVAFDADRWARITREVTAQMIESKAVLDANMDVSVSKQIRYLINSEGADIVDERVIYSIQISAQTRADDGMLLENGRSFYARSVDKLPTEAALKAEVASMLKDLEALQKAPVIDPYTGPAILEAEASGVLFHEAVGHRLEGERQRNEEEGRTFKGQVGKLVLPDFLSVYDDPTKESHDTIELNGHYHFDDEGVHAQRATLVEAGTLRGFLKSRTPIEDSPASNGHGRAYGIHKPIARMANLIVQADPARAVSREELKKMLLAEVKRQGKPFGLIIRDITGGSTNTSGYGYQAFKGIPRMIYKVDPETGAETLVRGAELVGTPLTAINKIVAASKETAVFNGYCGAESGYVPVSTISPALLTTELELQRSQSAKERAPLIPPPWAKP
jgi:TldD protein